MKDFEPDFSNKEAIIKFLNQIGISTEKELFKILKDRENQRKKLETKELKEIKKIEKNPFVVDENLSIDEKLAKGWKLLKNQPIFIDRKETTITVLEHPAGDIWEYIDGVPQEYIGKQLFTQEAAERETKRVGKTYLKSQKSLENIIENWSLENKDQIAAEKEMLINTGGLYQPIHDFLKKNCLLLGYRNSKTGKFSGIGKFTNVRVGNDCAMLTDKGDIRSKEMTKEERQQCGFPVYCYAE